MSTVQVEKLTRQTGQPQRTQGPNFTVTPKMIPDAGGNEQPGMEIECRGGRSSSDPVAEIDAHIAAQPQHPKTAKITGQRDALGFDKFGQTVGRLGEKGIQFQPNKPS